MHLCGYMYLSTAFPSFSPFFESFMGFLVHSETRHRGTKFYRDIVHTTHTSTTHRCAEKSFFYPLQLLVPAALE